MRDHVDLAQSLSDFDEWGDEGVDVGVALDARVEGDGGTLFATSIRRADGGEEFAGVFCDGDAAVFLGTFALHGPLEAGLEFVELAASSSYPVLLLQLRCSVKVQGKRPHALVEAVANAVEAFGVLQVAFVVLLRWIAPRFDLLFDVIEEDGADALHEALRALFQICAGTHFSFPL